MGTCIICQKPKVKNFQKLPSQGNLCSTESSSSLDSTKEAMQRSKSMDDFQPLKLVGKGSFGKVVLVKYFNNDKIYAMKILDKGEIIRRKQIKHTKTERLLLEKLNHPFIAQHNSHSKILKNYI